MNGGGSNTPPAQNHNGQWGTPNTNTNMQQQQQVPMAPQIAQAMMNIQAQQAAGNQQANQQGQNTQGGQDANVQQQAQPYVMQQMMMNPQMLANMMQMQGMQPGFQQAMMPMYFQATPQTTPPSDGSSPPLVGVMPQQMVMQQQNQPQQQQQNQQQPQQQTPVQQQQQQPAPTPTPAPPPTPAISTSASSSDKRIIKANVVESELLTIAREVIKLAVGNLEELPLKCVDYVKSTEFASGPKDLQQGFLKGLVLEAAAHVLHAQQLALNEFFIKFDSDSAHAQILEKWVKKETKLSKQQISEGMNSAHADLRPIPAAVATPGRCTPKYFLPEGISHRDVGFLPPKCTFIEKLYLAATNGDEVFMPLIIKEVLENVVPRNEGQEIADLSKQQMEKFNSEYIVFKRQSLERALCDIMEAVCNVCSQLAELAVFFLNTRLDLSACKQRILSFQKKTKKWFGANVTEED
eukprot:gene590-86_t